MWRKLTGAMLLLCTLLIVVIVGGVQAQAVSVLRIGVLDDLRGPVANGARLAADQINAAGGIQGADGTIFQVELLIVPSNFGVELDTAVAALTAANVVAVLGPETSEQVANGLIQLQGLNVPLLTPADSDTLIMADSSGRIVRTRAAEVYEGRALADYLISGLGADNITTVQLDAASTAGIVGFSTAAEAIGVQPTPLLLSSDTTAEAIIQSILTADAPVVVAYGGVPLASALYNDLREAGWPGVFAYTDATDPVFQASVPFDQLQGVLSTVTWPYSAFDDATENFRDAYVRAFGEVPGEIEAASYDAVRLIANAAELPGELASTLPQITEFEGVQGVLDPAGLGGREISTNVSVVRLGEYGAPEVLARYRDNQRLPDSELAATPIALSPTLVLDGVFVLIKSERQNIRSGPGEYPIIGQLRAGDRVEAIGTNGDGTWIVIDFQGQQGWLAVYLLDVIGDINTLPIIVPPPTPTPGITPTPTPQPFADVIIESASITPQPAQSGAPLVATINIRNVGGVPAGQFNIGATFLPNNQTASAVVAGLAPGEGIAVTLQVTLASTGFYTTSVFVDINNQVAEGPLGEANNTYNLNYIIDAPVLREASQTLNLGDTLDLEGDQIQGDLNWNGDDGVHLDAIFGAKLEILPISDFGQVHRDLLYALPITRDTYARAELNPGTVIGVITADGRRGAMRIDSINDQQIVVTFRVYAQ